MTIQASRAFRMSLTVALALAVAYGLALPIPYLAPIFALVFSAAPKPPMGLKGLIGLVILVTITLGIGLLLIPLLQHYAFAAILMVACGLYFSTYVSVILKKGAVGTFMTMGITLIPVAGMMGSSVALAMIDAILSGMAIAVVCQWIVYPFLPEPAAAPPPPPPPAEAPSNWIALRTALVVLPPFLVALTNPGAYLAMIMKSVSLGQQTSEVDTAKAGRDLILSTFLGGCFAVLFWIGLDILPSLWMFFLWTLLFGLYFGAKIFGALPGQFPPGLWLNVFITMLIMIGPAVQDSAGGKDVYKAFVVRLALFFAVTIYAWLAVVALEWWRLRRLNRQQLPIAVNEPAPS